MTRALQAFVAGFLATLVFHQGLLAVLRAAGATDRAPWSMAPTPPFGVPAVLSLAFWGGLWGIVLWGLIRTRRGRAYWGAALLLGAVLPSAVALLVVFPLKGLTWDGSILVGALLLNAAWGLGVALAMRSLAADEVR